jgi:hypothetical protein
MHRLFLFFLLLTALTINACGGNQTGPSGLQVTLEPPTTGQAEPQLTIQVADSQGQPVTDARVTVEGNMTHAGMAPVISDAVTDDADGAADGRYRVPFQFTMLGDWVLTITIQQAGGSASEQNIEVIVSDQSVIVK